MLHDVVPAGLEGSDIAGDHCVFVHEHGDVTLTPGGGALCRVDNVRVHAATKLTQGTYWAQDEGVSRSIHLI